MNPLVSVIVPTYNRREYLGECVDSVLKQTYNPVEVIVIDDGSTDGTDVFIQERYDKKVRYLPCRHSGLPAVARNAGLNEIRGEYVAFCDSDDFWAPSKLETQMQRLKETGCNCSCSDAFVVGAGEGSYLSQYVFREKTLLGNLLWENFFITSSVVMDSDLIRSRRFDESASLKGYEDYAAWLSLAHQLHIDYVDRPLVYYRKHESSLSAAIRHRDARQQMRLLCTQSAYRTRPALFVRKFLRCTYRLII